MDIVITTIFPPSTGAKKITAELAARGGTLWVVGDRKGPPAYDLPHTRFYSIEAQLQLPFELARILPERHYARKNLGYLAAMQARPEYLVETDDDNIPLDTFWEPRARQLPAERLAHPGWFNVYSLFTAHHIWPRGLPLQKVQGASRPALSAPAPTECLIQQGLANGDPDVDAVYRMTQPLPVNFNDRASVVLAAGTWCPFNTQNTTIYREAFPFLYLPTYCSFRMTDIWRSFVAQRCLWETGGSLSFGRATVYQERNEHDLLRDFEQEIPGYLKNDKIREVLEGATLKPGRAWSRGIENQTLCYEALVQAGIFPKEELPLLAAWSKDVLSLA